MSSKSSSGTSQEGSPNYDDFISSCENSDSYPRHLVRSRYRSTARQAMADSLKQRAELVFNTDEKRSELRFTDVCACSTSQESGTDLAEAPCQCEPDSRNITAKDALVAYLQSRRPNPRLRYVSIRAPSSRDRFDCSLAQFKYLCTYHDIAPSFLDCMYSFQASLYPLDYNLAMFNDENTLLAPPSQILPLGELDRSGREIRYSFLLRSIESSTSTPNQHWAIRQLAVYHSFDVVSGRSLWVTSKGNSAVESRIREAVSEDPTFCPSELKELPGAFSATLEVLSMVLDWCDDNWRWYINDLVDAVGRPTAKAKTVRVIDETDFGQVRRLVTGFDAKEQSVEQPSRTQTLALESGILLKDFKKRVSFGRNMSTVKSSAQLEGDINKLEGLKIFSLNELQKLQRDLEKIEQAILVLKLNRQVIRQIREHYRSLMTEYRIPETKNIQENCEGAVLRMSQHSRGIENNMLVRQEQLESLLLLVKEGTTLYDGILQYKALQINKIYAESAQMSARKMEALANKTKQETSSMHFITVLTLIFLPGTFIASFFQSGILVWPELEPKEGWELNQGVFRLFMTISGIMLTIIILIWLTTLTILRRQFRASANQG